jgi:hypothetical protein
VTEHEDQTFDTSESPPSTNFPDRMGAADAGSDHKSGSDLGLSSEHAKDGDPSGQDRAGASSNGDHLRKRRAERVPTPNDVGKLEDALLEAFKQGDPERAYVLVRDLADLALSSVVDAAKARFKANFGSERCLSCEGMKVSPGVVATCVQVTQCYYKNFKQGDLTPKQARILRVLG